MSSAITKSSKKRQETSNLESDCIKSRRDKIGITRHIMMHQVLYIVQLPNEEGAYYCACTVYTSIEASLRTPDVEAVAVVRIVWRADQIHTVSPTSSRHRQVVKHDAIDLGDEGGQHHAVKRHYNTRAPTARLLIEARAHCTTAQTHVMSSVRKMADAMLLQSQRFQRNARRLPRTVSIY